MEPIKTFLIESNPKDLIILLSNHAIKLINAIAKITPGIAYPEIDKVEKNCKNLLLKILTTKFENNDKQIIISEESIISLMEFRFNCSSCL